jgi:spoIIIJ-associated protein
VLAVYGGPAEAPAAVPAATPTGALACEVVRRVVAGLRLPAHVALEEEPERVVVTVDGPDLGLLIGKHGATIDALQYLLNAMAHRALESPAEVVVDAQGYRARRERTLTEVADRAAERVRESGRPVDLEPMIAGERKVVHLHLKAVTDVRTESDGREPNRFVRVLPA